jgi:hypothetical protein
MLFCVIVFLRHRLPQRAFLDCFFSTACRKEHSWIVSSAPLVRNQADYMLAVKCCM